MAEDELSQKRREVENKITKWLHDEGYKIDPIANDKSYYYSTVYTITPGGNKTSRISIDIPKDSLDKINVGAVFGYKLMEKPSYFTNDADRSNRCNTAITDTLDTYNVRWSINATVEDNEIEITKTIFFDGLSKHILFDTIGDVRVAHRAVNNTYKRLQKPE